MVLFAKSKLAQLYVPAARVRITTTALHQLKQQMMTAMMYPVLLSMMSMTLALNQMKVKTTRMPTVTLTATTVILMKKKASAKKTLGIAHTRLMALSKQCLQTHQLLRLLSV